jgi:transcriptional regulator with XRE-family HTH domain
VFDVLVAAQPVDIGTLARANIRAARARLKLTQAQIARRMRALGYGWYQQTAGLVERNQRPLLADELAALALALETTVDQLALPPPGVAVVLFGDQLVPAQRLFEDDGSVTWEGDAPKISEGMGSVPQATLDALRRARRLARHTGGDVQLAEPPSPEPTGEES